jgi:hypothetical protein
VLCLVFDSGIGVNMNQVTRTKSVQRWLSRKHRDTFPNE